MSVKKLVESMIDQWLEEKKSAVYSVMHKGQVFAQFDNEEEANKHMERYAKRGDASSYKVVKESLEESRDQKLRNHALKAAHPFGGAAEPSQEKLLDALEKEGFIEVTSYDPLDNSIFYELTAKGKSHVKSMKEDLDESKFNDYKVMVDGKHIMTVNAKDEDQAYKIVDGQLQHLRKFVGKASPAVKDLKIKKWSGRLPEYDNIDIVKESLDESKNSTISKLRDMVNKKTESRLINAGGKLTKFTLKQASKIVSLYDNQRPDEKARFEQELNREAGLKSIMKMVNKYMLVGEGLEESDYKVMHKTFTDAVNTAKEKAEKAGYTIDDDEWFRKVSSGPRKPGTDKTNRYSIELLTKRGNSARKHLHFQVYNTGGAYELNAYIN